MKPTCMRNLFGWKDFSVGGRDLGNKYPGWSRCVYTQPPRTMVEWAHFHITTMFWSFPVEEWICPQRSSLPSGQSVKWGRATLLWILVGRLSQSVNLLEILSCALAFIRMYVIKKLWTNLITRYNITLDSKLLEQRHESHINPEKANNMLTAAHLWWQLNAEWWLWPRILWSLL